MSLYEVLSTFDALKRRQREKKYGKPVTKDDMEEFGAIGQSINDPSVVWN